MQDEAIIKLRVQSRTHSELICSLGNPQLHCKSQKVPHNIITFHKSLLRVGSGIFIGMVERRDGGTSYLGTSVVAYLLLV